MKNHTEYPLVLPKSDKYDTDPNIKRSFFSTIIFYWELYKIVKYCNNQTKKNIYDRYNWVASSIAVLRTAEKAGMKVTVRGMKNLTFKWFKRRKSCIRVGATHNEKYRRRAGCHSFGNIIHKLFINTCVRHFSDQTTSCAAH